MPISTLMPASQIKRFNRRMPIVAESRFCPITKLDCSSTDCLKYGCQHDENRV